MTTGTKGKRVGIFSGEGVTMAVKCNVKRCLWLALVVLMSWVLILEGKAVVDAILAHPDLTVRDDNHLCWSLQKMTVFYTKS